MTTEEFKKEVLNAKQKVLEALEEKEAAARAKQAESDAAAAQARDDALKAEADKLWGGVGPDGAVTDSSTTAYGMAHKMSKEAGGQGYENFTSTMARIVEFAILLRAAIAADVRSGTRLADLAGGLGSVGLSLASKVASGVLHPIDTKDEVAEALLAFDRKWIHWETGKGATLKIPETMLKFSSCDEGKLTVQASKDEPSLATRPELAKMLDDLHTKVLEGFLGSKGYSKNHNGEFFKQKNGTDEKLSAQDFLDLRDAPKDGLAAFQEKHYGIKVTNDPVSFEGGEPEPPKPFSRP